MAKPSNAGSNGTDDDDVGWIPAERMPYGVWFTLPGSVSGVRYRLLDYCEQSITSDGGLCRDKPLLASDQSGRPAAFAWGTLVRPAVRKG